MRRAIIGYMTLTSDDLAAMNHLFEEQFERMFEEKFELKFEQKFEEKFESKFMPIRGELKAMDYKLDTIFDGLERRIDLIEGTLEEIRSTTNRIERVQSAGIGRLDRLDKQVASIHRELGLA